ncbi:jg19728 [Pararge aegeria aegeria]|uniref:Jg19728 protein n=1 Tax=Pararge aegeria aegeria TaxID=348720 RepID=A0A8S4RSW4_9NEOP|nr:jg19728 [Pararge aegeria aegeria]
MSDPWAGRKLYGTPHSKGGIPKLNTTAYSSCWLCKTPGEPVVYHPPQPIVGAPALTRRGSRQLEPPLDRREACLETGSWDCEAYARPSILVTYHVNSKTHQPTLEQRGRSMHLASPRASLMPYLLFLE